jgi:hypothetical protein
MNRSHTIGSNGSNKNWGASSMKFFRLGGIKDKLASIEYKKILKPDDKYRSSTNHGGPYGNTGTSNIGHG